jgi:Skp family chaperone for outer membrane proteins
MITRKRHFTIVGILTLSLAVLIGYQAGGGAAIAGQPTAIVTVNLGAVLENLQQRADAEANLNDMKAKMKTEDETRRAEITKLQEDFKALGGGPDKEALQEKIAFEGLKYNAWTNMAKRKVDIEHSLVMQDLYRTIKHEAKLLADASGYDAVFVDDSQGELAVNPELNVSREVQIRQQIVSRRLLYASKTIDVTDALIVRMNNAWNTPGAKGPGQ